MLNAADFCGFFVIRKVDIMSKVKAAQGQPEKKPVHVVEKYKK